MVRSLYSHILNSIPPPPPPPQSPLHLKLSHAALIFFLPLTAKPKSTRPSHPFWFVSFVAWNVRRAAVLIFQLESELKDARRRSSGGEVTVQVFFFFQKYNCWSFSSTDGRFDRLRTWIFWTIKTHKTKSVSQEIICKGAGSINECFSESEPVSESELWGHFFTFRVTFLAKWD